LAASRVLPVDPSLACLLPDGGLRRGSVLTVGGRGQGVTSLALGLTAAASQAGSWCGVVGVADLGLIAAAAAGLDLARVAIVSDLAPAQWTTVVSVLVDAVDLVIVSPPPHVRLGDVRRLVTRVRERGAVLLALAGLPEGADVRLTVEEAQWYGPGAGDGHLENRRIVVATGGRGAASRPQRVTLWLPAPPAYAGSDVESGAADEALFPVATVS
jgi:hypothetical protein